MSFAPHLWATFCDDVRQEAGNKLSYMGIYGSNLVVPSFPTTLVKLCCVFSLRVPAQSPPKSVIFRLLRDDEVLYEADVSSVEPMRPAASPADAQERWALTIGTIAQLLSFPVTQNSRLKARAVVDGVELRGGALDLMAVSAMESSSA